MNDFEFIELCKIGSLQQINDAIKNGANVNAKRDDGLTALMWAALNNPNPEVITALVKASANVSATDNKGWTALMFAVNQNSNPEVITALIKAGADINNLPKVQRGKVLEQAITQEPMAHDMGTSGSYAGELVHAEQRGIFCILRHSSYLFHRTGEECSYQYTHSRSDGSRRNPNLRLEPAHARLSNSRNSDSDLWEIARMAEKSD